MNNILICVCGMCGSGKSEVMNYLRNKFDLGYIRFGQTVLDIVKTQTDKPTEEIERKVRLELREKHGMAAMAIVNMPKIDTMLQEKSVVVDGLYSWEEYLVLKEKYAENLLVIAVYSSPTMRYERLTHRAEKYSNDKDLYYRSYTADQAYQRDKAEIEEIHKAGPIAMADYTIINDSDINDLQKKCDELSAVLNI